MAFSYSNTVKDNRMSVVNDAVNSKTYVAGSGAGSAGTLVIGTSALSGATGVLATVTLQNPAFTEASQVLTLAGVPLTANPTAGGTAAKAEVRNNAGTVIIGATTQLTVGTSASEVIVNTVTVAVGVPFQVSSATFTHG